MSSAVNLSLQSFESGELVPGSTAWVLQPSAMAAVVSTMHIHLLCALGSLTLPADLQCEQTTGRGRSSSSCRRRLVQGQGRATGRHDDGVSSSLCTAACA
jgi:hypothetical protein